MRIRRFRKNDSIELSKLIINNLKKVNKKDYSKKVIEFLISRNTPQKIIEKSKKDVIFVAEFNGEVVGTVGLQNNRIRNVFVASENHDKGIGKELINKIEEVAKEENKRKLIVYSSLTAENFYKKLGYKTVKKLQRNFDGVKGIVVEMEKTI